MRITCVTVRKKYIKMRTGHLVWLQMNSGFDAQWKTDSRCMRKSQVLKPLAGMMEDEAQIVFSKFKEAGVNCRLLPSRF